MFEPCLLICNSCGVFLLACLLAGELSFFVKNNKRLKLFWEISKIKSKFLFKFIKYFNYFNYFTQVRFIEVGAFQGGQDGEKKRMASFQVLS